MKNIIIITGVLLWLLCQNAFSQTITIDNLKYSISESDVTVLGFENKPTEDVYLEIPQSIEYEGIIYNVTRIGGHAFSEWSLLKSVSIPNSVTTIESNAFYKSANLKKVIIGNSCRTLGGMSFYACNSLDTVICYNPTPPALIKTYWATPGPDYYWDVFNSHFSVLCVPQGCINAYSNESFRWSKWANVIREIPKVSLTQSEIQMNPGEKMKMNVSIRPIEDNGKPLQWKSTDESVITVDENGLVTAIKHGNASIIVTLKSYIDAVDKCDVEVTQSVEGITLNETSIILEEFGNMVKLNATILPEDASDKSVRWSSSNPNVCTVTQNGTVVAVGNGTATVIATTVDGDIPASCVVNVKDYVYDTNRDGAIDVADIAAIISKMAAMARSQKQTEE